jgi:hypothetical protein
MDAESGLLAAKRPCWGIPGLFAGGSNGLFHPFERWHPPSSPGAAGAVAGFAPRQAFGTP